MTIERRFLFGENELRVAENDGHPKITGYAAVFDSQSEVAPGMLEVVRRGAFTKTLLEGDPFATFNHNVNIVLGRRSAGTLRVVEDSRGLAYEIDAPTTQLVQDTVLAPLRRGDVRGSSFSFRAVQAPRESGVRNLTEVRLFELGPVTMEAYPETSSELRALFADCTDETELAFFASLRASGLTSADVQAMIDRKAELVDVRGIQSLPTNDGWNGRMRQKLTLLS